MNERAVERRGSCHCGGVRFTVRMSESFAPRRCNCSICAKKGVAMVDVPSADLIVDAGEKLLTTYSFHSGAARHRFCSRCGIHPFHQTRTAPDRIAVNIACLDGIDPYAFAQVPVVDGTRHPMDHGGAARLAGWLRFEPPDEA